MRSTKSQKESICKKQTSSRTFRTFRDAKRFYKVTSKHSKKKLDKGKSCIKFKYYNDIPYELIGELVSKISVSDRVQHYESVIKKN
jgi:hypothetical protein